MTLVLGPQPLLDLVCSAARLGRVEAKRPDRIGVVVLAVELDLERVAVDHAHDPAMVGLRGIDVDPADCLALREVVEVRVEVRCLDVELPVAVVNLVGVEPEVEVGVVGDRVQVLRLVVPVVVGLTEQEDGPAACEVVVGRSELLVGVGVRRGWDEQSAGVRDTAAVLAVVLAAEEVEVGIEVRRPEDEWRPAAVFLVDDLIRVEPEGSADRRGEVV